MNNDLILGWFLGLISSLLTGFVMFWLEGLRSKRNEAQEQRREDIRIARNWGVDGKKVSLRGFDLSGANLSGKDLSGADLEDANLQGVHMWGTNLTEANLIRANFSKAKIIGANFIKADLHSADFSKAIIGDTSFAEARLRRTKFGKVKKVENCTWKSAKFDETTEVRPELHQEILSQLSFAGESVD